METPWADSPLTLIPTPVFLTKRVSRLIHEWSESYGKSLVFFLFIAAAFKTWFKSHDSNLRIHVMDTSPELSLTSQLCMVHNSLFRGYNSIYHQALHIESADKADFIGYCLTWHKFLKSHADNEESSLFLKMEELLDDRKIFEESHEEHDRFMPGIEKFQEYLTSLASPIDFSGSKLLEIMETFQEPFEKHMRSEITTIADLAGHERTPKVGSPEEKSTAAAFDSREGKNLLTSGITDVMPFFLFNFDCAYEDGLWKDWPPIPGPVKWILLSVAQWKHPGWWKFASCDASRNKKLLYAIPTLERD